MYVEIEIEIDLILGVIYAGNLHFRLLQMS